MRAGLLELLSPRHRRWRRLLDSLVFDPDAGPLEAPGPDDFVICGSPRTGTTLTSAVLFQPPRVVTVSEPWDALRMPPADVFRSFRDEIERTGRLGRGRLDVEHLRATGAVEWGRDGHLDYAVDVDDRYFVGVKWPAFWRLLDHLPTTKFLVCLRDPVEVIESYRTKGGALADGLDYDAAINRAMNEQLVRATRDPRLRQVLMYDHINERIIPHLDRPNVLPVRYERWFEDRSGLLAEIGAFLGVELGDGLPVIRPARSSGHDPAVVDLVRRHCRTAARLGYAVT